MELEYVVVIDRFNLIRYSYCVVLPSAVFVSSTVVPIVGGAAPILVTYSY